VESDSANALRQQFENDSVSRDGRIRVRRDWPQEIKELFRGV
jgi:hypothetical protein